MTLRTRLERIERRAVPTATNAQDARAILAGKLDWLAERCEPAWFTTDPAVGALLRAILADLGIDLDECTAWARIAGDGAVEMTTDTGVFLADADACRVASELVARIGGGER